MDAKGIDDAPMMSETPVSWRNRYRLTLNLQITSVVRKRRKIRSYSQQA